MIKQISARKTFYFFLSATFIMSAFLIFISSPAFTSDSSDAEDLLKRCQNESKALEIAVTNFGSEAEKAKFKNGIDIIKMGRVKIAQTMYLDASSQFKNYLKLQNEIYDTLCVTYLKRTETILQNTGVDVVDSIDDPKVEQYIKLANQNLVDAKGSYSRKEYTPSIGNCRTAKKYAFKAYEITGKAVPEQYKVDQKDNDNKM